MRIAPGETWFVEFGLAKKPRWGIVIGAAEDGRLALASVVAITTRFDATPYEVALPRVPWLREQSYVNAQSIQPVKLSELARKAPGKFDDKVFAQIKSAVKLWLRL